MKDIKPHIHTMKGKNDSDGRVVDEHVIDIGIDDTIVIDKMFGPAIVYPIRIEIDWENFEWVIYQENEETEEMARFKCDPTL